MCAENALAPKADLMHFTNEETKAEPLAPFIQIQTWLWGPDPGAVNPDHYFFHTTLTDFY